ncbi:MULTISPECIES: N-acetyltransferase [unclassified Leucobacter]|uniref:GNAT family N-acetyltransferase n=1 Tax=unclassified Leucobacter TaxID=2621730 RepID=UPI00165E8953|nr:MULTISPECIES: GNAT family N-acetyltransferase [unclassified Leucobacter]MBC9928039.1 GNAT family N-acetyltransferase [Leucobacter sp. cx-169]
MESVTIELGFDESERAQVGTLYWEAFRQKLGLAFSSAEVGLRVLRAALRSDRVLVGRSEDAVVGVCGFYANGIGAADLTWRSLRGIQSVGQALRSVLVLSVLGRSEKKGTLVLDGICVDANQRGAGIGTALLDAAERYARQEGLSSVRLSVIDRNPRAEALYQRRGFRPVDAGSMGVLGYVYGFDRYTVMEKKLTP